MNIINVCQNNLKYPLAYGLPLNRWNSANIKYWGRDSFHQLNSAYRHYRQLNPLLSFIDSKLILNIRLFHYDFKKFSKNINQSILQ